MRQTYVIEKVEMDEMDEFRFQNIDFRDIVGKRKQACAVAAP